MTAFDYGRYDLLYADPRTHRVLDDVDGLAKKMRIKYALIGGLAAYIYKRNPPDDYPDIDFLIYDSAERAADLIWALLKKPKWSDKFIDTDESDMIFAALFYDKEIQVDIFTSLDEKKKRPTVRKEKVELEMLEPLIVEKLIRGTQSDVRVALDLLAFCDYDRKLLSQIGREYRLTGMLADAGYWARRIKAGVVKPEGIAAVVKRLATAGE